MVIRNFWHSKLDNIWKRRRLIWLAGVRRSGKTCLCESIRGAEIFDCELPRTRRMIEGDPEGFLNDLRNRTIVFDEIHRLSNPSEVLKIAVDHYPDIRLIATGSSTLGASRKFRDTLTGRKETLWLTPMIAQDSEDFGNTNIDHRFLHGGLPPFFASKSINEIEYQEWIDAFWAKDVVELYRLTKRDSFQKMTELVFAQSGGQFNSVSMGRACGVSHTTAAAYLEILRSSFVAHVIRPFSTSKESEIVKQPKVYAFDTGFACYFKGISSLRPEDRGDLWEHYVLNELHANLQTQNIMYWRTKSGDEIDFIIPNRSDKKAPTAIECKWSSEKFSYRAMKAFRQLYPSGLNFVVCRDVDRSFRRDFDGVKVAFVTPKQLVKQLSARPSDKTSD
jgi:predicted AAA+ superfamily ATPase